MAKPAQTRVRRAAPAPEPTLADVLEELRALRRDIGTEESTESGTKATGIFARLYLVEVDNRQIKSLKSQGVAALGGILVVLGIFYLGGLGFLKALIGGGALHH